MYIVFLGTFIYSSLLVTVKQVRKNLISRYVLISLTYIIVIPFLPPLEDILLLLTD